MEALARAREAAARRSALRAQEERMEAEAARTLRNAERAKEHGLVEKTAGESGGAGRLRNTRKWVESRQCKKCKTLLFIIILSFPV